MTERILITHDNIAELDLHRNYGWGVIDTETDGLYPYLGNRIIGISLYFSVIDTSYYISVRHPETNNVDPEWYVDSLLYRLPLMANVWIMFNSKFDMHMLSVDGMKDFTRIEDVMLAAQLINENEWLTNGFNEKGAYQLKRLAKKYLGADAVAGEEDLIAKAKERGLNPKSEMWKMPASDVAFYAMKDVEITWSLRNRYLPALEKWGQRDLYERRSEFVLKALLRMERNGIRVNPEIINAHRAKIEPTIKKIQEEFDNYSVGIGINFNGANNKDERHINLNSPMQVKEFFRWHGHEVDSTNVLVLKSLADKGDKFAAQLLEYRRLSKADSTYYEPYLNLMDSNNIIHTDYYAIGTNTGRLSSREPNLQNIPRKGRNEVKKVFVVRKGHTMIGQDYKALELRLAAHFADEQQIMRLFNAGGDPHQLTADSLGVTRDLGKTLNFGLLYGMGWKKAMLMYNLPSEQFARQVVQGWHDQYPAFRKAVNEYQHIASEYRGDGNRFQYLQLFNGRTRKYQELLKYGYDHTRDGFNFMVQGTGAAVNEESILRVVEHFTDNDMFVPMLAVHDSFVYEIPKGQECEIVPVVTEIMEDWPQFKVKLQVETKMTRRGYYYL